MAAHNELGLMGEQWPLSSDSKRIHNQGTELAISKSGGRYYRSKGITFCLLSRSKRDLHVFLGTLRNS